MLIVTPDFLAESRSPPLSDFGVWIDAGKRERIIFGAILSMDPIIAPPRQMLEVWAHAAPILAKVGATGLRASTTSASPTGKIRRGNTAETLMCPKIKRA